MCLTGYRNHRRLALPFRIRGWRVQFAAYLNQTMVIPSFVTSRSGSPRSSGTVSSRFSTCSLKIEKSSPAMKSLTTPSFLRSPNDLRNPWQSLPPAPVEPYRE